MGSAVSKVSTLGARKTRSQWWVWNGMTFRFSRWPLSNASFLAMQAPAVLILIKQHHHTSEGNGWNREGTRQENKKGRMSAVHIHMYRRSARQRNIDRWLTRQSMQIQTVIQLLQCYRIGGCAAEEVESENRLLFHYIGDVRSVCVGVITTVRFDAPRRRQTGPVHVLIIW